MVLLAHHSRSQNRPLKGGVCSSSVASRQPHPLLCVGKEEQSWLNEPCEE